MKDSLIIGCRDFNEEDLGMWQRQFHGVVIYERFYRINCKAMNKVVTIAIDSEQGEKIKELIFSDSNAEIGVINEIQEKVLNMILPLITAKDFFAAVDAEKSKSWDDGYKKAQLDIRKAIGCK